MRHIYIFIRSTELSEYFDFSLLRASSDPFHINRPWAAYYLSLMLCRFLKIKGGNLISRGSDGYIDNCPLYHNKLLTCTLIAKVG